MTTETIFEKEITCPYCQYEYEESYDYGLENDGDCDDMKCPECQKIFRTTLDISVTYCTIALCEENKINHEWNNFNHDGRTGKMCQVCDKVEFDNPDTDAQTSQSLGDSAEDGEIVVECPECMADMNQYNDHDECPECKTMVMK